LKALKMRSKEKYEAAYFSKKTNIFFIESIKDEIREKYEAVYFDQKTKVKVVPMFVETGNY
jgi:hypothetical protein